MTNKTNLNDYFKTLIDSYVRNNDTGTSNNSSDDSSGTGDDSYNPINDLDTIASDPTADDSPNEDGRVDHDGDIVQLTPDEDKIITK